MKEVSSKASLDMNVKTKTMIISRDPEGKKVDIKVDETLQQVEKFICLGTLISEEIKTDKEIERRKNIAKEKFSSMAKILKSKRLKLATKLKIVKCYISSIFTYGCEAWTLSKVLETKIEVFVMWCLRELGNVMWKDKVTNESVLTKLKTKRQLLSDIQKRKFKYFGHIKGKNNILTTVLELGKLESKRPRGRPRNNWMADIKEWTCRPAYACASQAAGRDLWSVIARQPSKRRDTRYYANNASTSPSPVLLVLNRDKGE